MTRVALRIIFGSLGMLRRVALVRTTLRYIPEDGIPLTGFVLSRFLIFNFIVFRFEDF
jgi:hypothetical protein